MKYFDSGELQSSTDPGLHTTSHLYDLAYQGAYSNPNLLTHNRKCCALCKRDL